MYKTHSYTRVKTLRCRKTPRQEGLCRAVLRELAAEELPQKMIPYLSSDEKQALYTVVHSLEVVFSVHNTYTLVLEKQQTTHFTAAGDGNCEVC